MLPRVTLLVLIVLFAGCATSTSFLEFPIPPKGSNHYAGPDGRDWIPHPLTSPEGTVHSLVFVPANTSMTNWSEKISFDAGKGRMTHAAVKKILDSVLELDPGLVYSIEDKSDSMFVMTYSSPKWNEQGITKQILTESGYYSVSYTTRLGPPGAQRFSQWKSIIERAVLDPNKFP